MSLGKFLSKAAPVIGGAIGFAVGGPGGAALGAGIGGSAGGAIAGHRAEGAERRAARDQRRLAYLQSLRQRKELIREVQFAQASATAANVASGAGFASSARQGQQASQRSMLRDDLGFQDVGGDISDSIWRHTRRADSWRTAGATSQALGQIGSMLGTFAGPGQGSEFVNLPDHGTVPQGGTPVPRYFPPPGGRGA